MSHKRSIGIGRCGGISALVKDFPQQGEGFRNMFNIPFEMIIDYFADLLPCRPRPVIPQGRHELNDTFRPDVFISTSPD